MRLDEALHGYSKGISKCFQSLRALVLSGLKVCSVLSFPTAVWVPETSAGGTSPGLLIYNHCKSPGHQSNEDAEGKEGDEMTKEKLEGEGSDRGLVCAHQEDV